jgi:hypothetical protein
VLFSEMIMIPEARLLAATVSLAIAWAVWLWAKKLDR